MYNEKMKRSQNGSALIYILIAVALIAALTYAVTRGSRTGESNLTKETSSLIASEIMEQAQTLARAVQKLRLRGIDETGISFENPTISGYTLAACASGDCKVFDLSGGGMNWLTPPAAANSGEDWLYAGTVGSTGHGANAGSYDLLMILPGIADSICMAINEKLNITAPGDAIPVADDATLSASKLATATPISASAETIADSITNGKTAYCIKITTPSGDLGTTANTNYFVQVLFGG